MFSVFVVNLDCLIDFNWRWWSVLWLIQSWKLAVHLNGYISVRGKNNEKSGFWNEKYGKRISLVMNLEKWQFLSVKSQKIHGNLKPTLKHNFCSAISEWIRLFYMNFLQQLTLHQKKILLRIAKFYEFSNKTIFELNIHLIFNNESISKQSDSVFFFLQFANLMIHIIFSMLKILTNLATRT